MGDTPTLTPKERVAFERLANLLIPGGGGMPSASGANVAGEGLEAVLKTCPRMTGHLLRGIHAAGDARSVDEVKAVLMDDELAWFAVKTAVAGAYFLHPEVRIQLGYPGAIGHHMDPFETTRQVEAGLLDGVVRRASET